MRKTILASVFLAAFAVCGHAQTTQELIEAYRNGTLTQSQIDQYNNTAVAESDQNRNREIQVENVDELPQVDTLVQNADIARSRIFGHDLFTIRQLTFEPNLSIATPDNYVLGPGDEVIVDVWGDSQMTIRATVSPEGKIFISNVGPVSLAGLTIAEASSRVRGALMSIYEGLADGSVQMKLSLGSIRSIQVNKLDELKW